MTAAKTPSETKATLKAPLVSLPHLPIVRRYCRRRGQNMCNMSRTVKLTASNKQWWKIIRELLHRKTTLSSVQSLRESAKWLSDEKKSRCICPRLRAQSTSSGGACRYAILGCAINESIGFFSFRSCVTLKLFKKFDECKATGGDMISATALKRLCDCLAVPFTIVIRRLFHAGCWPSAWKYHLICPILKKGICFQT